jgi:hypothetical protein
MVGQLQSRAVLILLANRQASQRAHGAGTKLMLLHGLLAELHI